MEAFVRRVLVFLLVGVGASVVASAQVTPGAGYTPSDDTPSIKVGMTSTSDTGASTVDSQSVRPKAVVVAKISCTWP